MTRKPLPIKPTGPDAGPWIDLGNGRFRSASTGRMRYDPNADPAWHDSIKRIQAQEQAAAAKRALDALGTGTVFDSINQVPVTTEASAYGIALQILERREFRNLVWFGENKLIWEKKA